MITLTDVDVEHIIFMYENDIKRREIQLKNDCVLPIDRQIVQDEINKDKNVLSHVEEFKKLNFPKEGKKLYYFKDMEDTIIDSAVCYSYEQACNIREYLENSLEKAIYIDEE